MRYAPWAACLAALFFCGTAQAAPAACAPRDDVLNQLASKYKEAPVAIGLANSGGLLEIVTSAKGETWTIIITMPNGVSCLMASGEDWQDIKPEPAPVGDPS